MTISRDDGPADADGLPAIVRALRNGPFDEEWWATVSAHRDVLLDPALLARLARCGEQAPDDWAPLLAVLQLAAERGIERARAELPLVVRGDGSDQEGQLARIDAMLAAVEHHQASWLLTALAHSLAEFGAPLDRVLRWASLVEELDPEDMVSLARLVVATDSSERLSVVTGPPPIRAAAVRRALRRISELRVDATIQALVEVLDRCAQIDPASALEEFEFAQAAYANLIDHPEDRDLHLRDLSCLQHEGEVRCSAWLLQVAMKVGASLLADEPKGSADMMMPAAKTMYLLSGIHAMEGRYDEADRYIDGAIQILEGMHSIVPEVVGESLDVSRRMKAAIDESREAR